MSYLAAYIVLSRRDKEPPTVEKMVDFFEKLNIDKYDRDAIAKFVEQRKSGDLFDIAMNLGVWSIKQGDKITELRLRKKEEEDVVVDNLFPDEDGY